jgi:hypothetical protein
MLFVRAFNASRSPPARQPNTQLKARQCLASVTQHAAEGSHPALLRIKHQHLERSFDQQLVSMMSRPTTVTNAIYRHCWNRGSLQRDLLLALMQ